LEKNVSRLWSDWGEECDVNAIRFFSEKNRIIHETTTCCTSQLNEIAKRKKRTFEDMMNAILINSCLHGNMYKRAILFACHILNKVPHNKLEKNP